MIKPFPYKPLAIVSGLTALMLGIYSLNPINRALGGGLSPEARNILKLEREATDMRSYGFPSSRANSNYLHAVSQYPLAMQEINQRKSTVKLDATKGFFSLLGCVMLGTLAIETGRIYRSKSEQAHCVHEVRPM